MVDFASGSARKLSHDSVHATLQPLPEEAPLPVPAALVPTVLTEPVPNGGQTEIKLLELKSLLDKGLITQEEYDQKRARILKGM